MNRLLQFCCIGMLVAMTSTLHASESVATDPDPVTTPVDATASDDAKSEAARLPGSSFGSQRGGLISGPGDSGEVCGDPDAGSCGGAAAKEASPAAGKKESDE